MLRIHDLLNNGLPRQKKSPVLRPKPTPQANTAGHRIDKLFRLKVHPALLKNIPLLNIALRRKLVVNRTANPDNCGLKLHRKLLEAGLRVRLIHAPLIYEIFHHLTPITLQSKCLYRLVGELLRAENCTQDLRAVRHGGFRPKEQPKSERPTLKQELDHGVKRDSLERPQLRSGPERPQLRPGPKLEPGSSSSTNYSDSTYGSSSGSAAPSMPLTNGAPSFTEHTLAKDFTLADSTGPDSVKEKLPVSDKSPMSRTFTESSTAELADLSVDSPEEKSPDKGSDWTHINHGGAEIGFCAPPPEDEWTLAAEFLAPGKLTAHTVCLIDNNLVDLAGVPSKVLKSLSYDRSAKADRVSTFNLLDTAVASLFGTRQYSLVRVTKLAATNTEGSVLVKLETASPGDPALIDDGEFIEDMVASLGTAGLLPSNLFIKKVVARPRYKVDMKLFFVPHTQPMLLYVDPRVLERDLINCVIDIDLSSDRVICTTFPAQPIIDKVRGLVHGSKAAVHAEPGPAVANHITENLHKYWNRTPSTESESLLLLLSTPLSRGLVFSAAESGLSSATSLDK